MTWTGKPLLVTLPLVVSAVILQEVRAGSVKCTSPLTVDIKTFPDEDGEDMLPVTDPLFEDAWINEHDPLQE